MKHKQALKTHRMALSVTNEADRLIGCIDKDDKLATRPTCLPSRVRV